MQAQEHADRWGCVWNRDIRAILKEASEKSGLQVDKVDTYHFGTTFFVVASPGASPQPGAAPRQHKPTAGTQAPPHAAADHGAAAAAGTAARGALSSNSGNAAGNATKVALGPLATCVASMIPKGAFPCACGCGRY